MDRNISRRDFFRLVPLSGLIVTGGVGLNEAFSSPKRNLEEIDPTSDVFLEIDNQNKIAIEDATSVGDDVDLVTPWIGYVEIDDGNPILANPRIGFAADTEGEVYALFINAGCAVDSIRENDDILFKTENEHTARGMMGRRYIQTDISRIPRSRFDSVSGAVVFEQLNLQDKTVPILCMSDASHLGQELDCSTAIGRLRDRAVM